MTVLLEAPTRRPPGTVPSGVPGRSRVSRPAWALAVVLVTGLTLGVRLHGMASGPPYRDDEGTYMAQAWAVAHQGSLAHYTYWYDHPPLGWLLIAVWRSLTEPFAGAPTEVLAGRQLMVVLAAVDAALLMALGRRLGLRWWASTAGALLWALSPLAVAFSRGVWLDNVALTFGLGALVCALSPRRHLWAFGASGVLLGLSVLSKETALLLGPAIVVAVLRGSAGRTRSFCLAAFGASALLVLLAFPLLAVLKGELLPGPGHVSLLQAVEWQLHGREPTGSPLDPHSGSANIVGQWLGVDAWLLAAGVLCAPLALVVRRLLVPALALLVPVAVGLRPGYLPEPYVVMLLPFCALLVAGLLDAALPRDRRLPATVGSALAACLVVTLVLTTWLPGLQRVSSGDATAQTVAVEEWVGRNVPHGDRVLVDDTLWVDLVRRGFDADLGVIWFYKTDFVGGLDPSVRKALPNGYRDIDWVVLSPIMRDALDANPHGLTALREAILHSTVARSVGTGEDRYDVLRVAG